MNKTIFLKEFMEQVWNKQRKDLVEKFVAEKYHIHLDSGDPWEGQTLDHETFKKRLDYSFQSFPDINFEITAAIEEVHHVAITWILTGTNLGNIGDFPPTNKSVKTTGMTFYFFEAGLISGHSQIFDRKLVMEQLGFG